MTKDRFVRIYFLPDHVEPSGLIGSTAIVIDLLRASTTIVHALGNGATKVIPVATVEEAKSLAASTQERLLLAGERNGIKIDGFELGNSPLEYASEKVRGRGIVLTTSNGTAAFSKLTAASEVVVGCLANLSATVKGASNTGNPINIVCSGDDGAPSLEDTLAAGMIAKALMQQDHYTLAEDDSTQMAIALLDHFDESSGALARAVWRSTNARNLVQLGLSEDVSAALKVDSYRLLPRLTYDKHLARPVLAAF